MASSLSVSSNGAVRILTLSRPERLNALDTALRQEIADRLAAFQSDDGVRAVVLTGAGERAFCAGQDLDESAALRPDEGPSWMESWRRYFDALSRFTKPIIAAVNGVAAGAGFETALLSDVRLMATTARFIMAEVDAGLPAIIGGHLLKIHLGISRATEIVLTGRAIPAEEARRIGLARDVLPPDRLLDRAVAFARELGDKPPVALRLDIERFRAVTGRGFAAATAASVAYQSEAVATGEPQKVMAAFLARRAQRRAG